MTKTQPPLTTFRLTTTEREQLDDLTKRLGLKDRTDTIRHAIFQLRRATGLLGDDVIRLHERLARDQGDDAELVFTVTSIDPRGVDVRLGDTPRDALRANLLYAAAGFVDDAGVDQFKLPPEGTIVMKDLDADATYTIGQIELREGAEKRVPIGDLADMRQGAHDDRTPDERRRDLAMNAKIRRAAREARGLPEPDDDELEDA